LQRRVRQDGRTVIGSSLIIYLKDLLPVTLSKKAAQFLFPTLGAPKVLTSMFSKIF
jgi:hypothetical protein